ncbi:hypothetical protein [Palleronia rufa]|uniref:hypothetical protein n=1 Tax=Palleronia rufa TaxID=1530186 RepID=UPI00056B340B|nr:hypothetical protein [Palleronia rufa]
MQGQFEVSAIDLSILIGYRILSRVLALWLTRGGAKDTDGFFLGGRNFIWPMIGFSLFATNMSGPLPNSRLTQFRRAPRAR